MPISGRRGGKVARLYLVRSIGERAETDPGDGQPTCRCGSRHSLDMSNDFKKKSKGVRSHQP